jgi:hypothetical protein
VVFFVVKGHVEQCLSDHLQFFCRQPNSDSVFHVIHPFSSTVLLCCKFFSKLFCFLDGAEDRGIKSVIVNLDNNKALVKQLSGHIFAIITDLLHGVDFVPLHNVFLSGLWPVL